MKTIFTKIGYKIKFIYQVIGCFILFTLLILNPFIIEATTIETKAQNIIELPQMSSSLYGVNTTVDNSTNSKLYSSRGLNATLKTKSFSNVKIGDEYNIKYEVNLPDLLQGVYEKYDEIVIAIDTSKYMYGEKWSYVKDFFANYFENTLGTKDVKMGIVPFLGQNVVVPDTSHGNDTNFESLLDLNNIDNINMIKDAFGKNYITAAQYIDQRQIDTALNKAKELLNPGFYQNKKQAIILITSGGYNVNWPGNISAFEKYQHKIITVSLEDGNDSSYPYSARTIHEQLGGEGFDFITGYIDGSPTPIQALTKSLKMVTTLPKIEENLFISPNNLDLSHLRVDNFDEVIIAIDVSNHMYDTKWKSIKYFFKNYFEHSKILSGIHMGIIPYHAGIEQLPLTNKDILDNLFDLSSPTEIQDIKNIFSKNHLYASQNIGIRRIDPVLKKAKELFSQNKNNKAIIFINSGNYNVDWEGNLSNFKDLGYKIITLNISDDIQFSDLGNAKSIHEKLGGEEENYIITNVDTSPTIIEVLNEIFGVDDFSGIVPPEESPLARLDVELQFDFGEYLNLVEGSCLIDGEHVEVKNENKKATYPIKKIAYSLVNGRYVFEPINVEFKVKVKDVAEFFTFNHAKITYRYGTGDYILKDIPKPIFNKLMLPNINATLEKATPNPASLDSQINVTYAINADSFDYDRDNNELKEIILLLDGTANNGFYKNFFEKAINGMSLYQFLQDNNVKLGLVIYGKNDEIISEYSLTTDIDLIKKAISSFKSSSGTPNLDSALTHADYILNEGTSKNKNIIIINNAEINYNQQNLKSLVKKYNIFTMDQSKDLKLRELHYFLKDIENTNNIDSEEDAKNGYIKYNGNGTVDGPLTTLLNKLTDELVNFIEVKDAKLVFDLGNNFHLSEDNLNVIESSNKKNVIEVPIGTIRYNLVTLNGKKQYVAESIPNITFKIKPLETGELTFTENTIDNIVNYISYSDLNAVNVKRLLETPTITVLEEVEIPQSSEIIQHGLYKNSSDSSFIEVKAEAEAFKVVKSMNYTFGMTMDIKSSSANIVIEIPKKVKNADVELNQLSIYLYELTEDELVDKTSKVIIPNSCILTNDASYQITNSNNSGLVLESGKKYLLTYLVRFKENSQLSDLNSSFEFLGTVDETHKNIQLEIKDDTYLPDLF